MKNIKPIYLIILAAIIITAFNTLFIVDQRQQALVLQFGHLVRAVKEPGLNAKLPFMQDVVYFDNRVLDLNSDSREVISSDEKRLIVDAFAKFKITDPLKFYQSVRDEQGARNRLSTILDSSLRQVLGSVPLSSLLTAERSKIMKTITSILDASMENYGLKVIDVRIMTADLPQKNSEAVYSRMQTEREREAKEFRAQGAEEAQGIRSRADRDKIVLLAEAEKKAQIMRGEGDAEASKIFAAAFGKDAEFAAFYRSMQAYREAFSSDDTTLVISPNSQFMKYFE